jgi:hypothetical protein
LRRRAGARQEQIHAVLDRHGLVKRMGRRRNRATGTPLSEGAAPNDLWGADFRGEFKLGNACGRICMHRKKINISTVLAGQRLGIKEVDEGIWLVSFMRYDLGYIDLEQRTLQTIDNPFGTRLSPMS